MVVVSNRRDSRVNENLRAAMHGRGWVNVRELCADVGDKISPDHALRRLASRQGGGRKLDVTNDVWKGRLVIVTKALFGMRYEGQVEARGTGNAREWRLIDNGNQTDQSQ